MRVTVFNTHSFERSYLESANQAHKHELEFLEFGLNQGTARIAKGSKAVCLFANDNGSRAVLTQLCEVGVILIALRSAGFNHVDIQAAQELGLTVLRVPGYSPYAVAEHTIGLILSLNRKIHRAYNRVREQNFSLDGLMGFDLHGRTCGVIGTGRIGGVVCRILLGFGCRVLAQDITVDQELKKSGVEYVDSKYLYAHSDIITLHCPLTPNTRHLIDSKVLESMKEGAMLINTGRGALIDTPAVIAALKSGRLGYLGLDVYEEEGDIFFRNLSEEVLKDDTFVRLMTFPNVLITSHQAFFTIEALKNIAETTMTNFSDFERGTVNPANQVTIELLK